MSSVTEVAVPTSDFDGNAPVNSSRDMASTFSESLYWRRSASAGIRFGAGDLRPGLCGLLVRP